MWIRTQSKKERECIRAENNALSAEKHYDLRTDLIDFLIDKQFVVSEDKKDAEEFIDKLYEFFTYKQQI